MPRIILWKVVLLTSICNGVGILPSFLEHARIIINLLFIQSLCLRFLWLRLRLAYSRLLLSLNYRIDLGLLLRYTRWTKGLLLLLLGSCFGCWLLFHWLFFRQKHLSVATLDGLSMVSLLGSFISWHVKLCALNMTWFIQIMNNHVFMILPMPVIVIKMFNITTNKMTWSELLFSIVRLLLELMFSLVMSGLLRFEAVSRAIETLNLGVIVIVMCWLNQLWVMILKLTIVELIC